MTVEINKRIQVNIWLIMQSSPLFYFSFILLAVNKVQYCSVGCEWLEAGLRVADLAFSNK